MVSKSTTAPRLVIVEGVDKGKVITLKHGTTVIGRSKGDVVIPDARMSRSHAAVHFDEKEGKLSFTDLRSLNGCYVNDEKVNSAELGEGDRLQIGSTTFDCQLYPPERTGSVSLHKLGGIASGGKEPTPAEAVKLGEESEPHVEADLGAEPESVPLDEDASEEERENTKPSKARKTPGMVARVREGYLKIPGKTRRLGLVTIALLFVVVYVMMDSGGTASARLEPVRQLQSQEKYEEAIALAEEVKAEFPRDSEVYGLLGDLYAHEQKNELAILSYQKARKFGEGSPALAIKLIKVYLRSGLTKQANGELKHVEEGIEKWPDNKSLLIEVAQLFLEFRELEQSSDLGFALAKALQNKLAPSSAIGYKLEAQILFKENNPLKALKVLEKARSLASNDEWIVENIALAKFRMKDYESATSVVEDWIRMKPTSTKALLIMSYLKFSSKDMKGSLDYIKRLIAIVGDKGRDPYYAEGLNLAGQVYLVAGQKQEATRLIRLACQSGYKPSCDHHVLLQRTPQSTKPMLPPVRKLPKK